MKKSWEERSGSWQCGIPLFEKACAKCLPPRLAPKERARTWGTGLNCAQKKTPCGPIPWNPTLAHKTRKDGAPGSTRVLGRTPGHFAEGVGHVGVLRLRSCFASRSGYSAQDDIL